MTLSDSFERLSLERRSTRAFLDRPVSDSLLKTVVTLARRAPSGANLQPGSVIAVQGDARQRLSRALIHAWSHGGQEAEDYSYFPSPLPMTLRRRQVASAQALYGALDIARDDRAGRDLQFERNFRFFDAPVALLITLEHDFGSGGYMDLGMFIYGLILAAQAQGLSSCAIGAMASFPNLIRQQLALDAGSKIVCGIALGYADPGAPVNRTQTTRCDLDDYFRVIA